MHESTTARSWMPRRRRRDLATTAMIVAVAMLSTSCLWVRHASLTSAGGEVTAPVLALDVSADGRYVLVATTGVLHPDDTNTTRDLYVRDTATNTTTLATYDAGGGPLDAHVSLDGEISDDGRFVVFSTTASDVVAGDTGTRVDVFLRDMEDLFNTRISRTANGSNPDLDSYEPAISADGSVVVYTSAATDIVTDNNGVTDVFRFDTATGGTTRISTSAAGAEANGFGSDQPTVDADGNLIAFRARSSNLVAGTGFTNHIFLKSTAGPIEVVSQSSTGAFANSGNEEPSISADGTRIAFTTFADNVAAGDTDFFADVALRDIAAGTTTNASASIATPASRPSIDNAGMTVAYGDDVAQRTVVWEADTFQTHVVSVNLAGNPFSGFEPHLSGDGRYVAFESTGKITDTDTDTVRDVYVIAHREPVPTSVSPPIVSRGAGTALTVAGSGFEPGATVLDLSGAVSFINVVVHSSTLITADVLVPGGTPTGPRWVNVQNPDGGPGVNSGSFGNCQCLTVTN